MIAVAGGKGPTLGNAEVAEGPLKGFTMARAMGHGMGQFVTYQLGPVVDSNPAWINHQGHGLAMEATKAINAQVGIEGSRPQFQGDPLVLRPTVD